MKLTWVVNRVTFGKVTRTSTLGHLVEYRDNGGGYSGPTLCGATLVDHVGAPDSFIRCQRCIDARGQHWRPSDVA